MPIGTKVGAASSGGNIKLKDSIGKVVGPTEYIVDQSAAGGFRLGSLSKSAWINRRDYLHQDGVGSTLVKESSPDNFYSYYSSGDGNSSDYQQDGSWSGGGPNSGINDNTPAAMGEFSGVQNDYWSVGTQLVGRGVPQRYIGFSPATQVSSTYKHAGAARNDFGAGFSFQDYTIGTYCRRNGDHLSIFVGATVNGETVSRGSDGGIRGIGSVGASTNTSQVFTTPYGNTQPVDYQFHGSSINSQTAWYDASSNNTNPYSNHKEIYRLENACASDGPTAEPHSGGNGSGEFVQVRVLPPITTINVNNHPNLNQTVRRYVDNGSVSNFNIAQFYGTLMTSTNTAIGAEIRTVGFMQDINDGFQSLGIAVPFLININGVGNSTLTGGIAGQLDGGGSTGQSYSSGQGVLQDNAAGSHSTSDMIRTGYLPTKLIFVGIRADTDKTSSGSPQTFVAGFNYNLGNIFQ